MSIEQILLEWDNNPEISSFNVYKYINDIDFNNIDLIKEIIQKLTSNYNVFDIVNLLFIYRKLSIKDNIINETFSPDTLRFIQLQAKIYKGDNINSFFKTILGKLKNDLSKDDKTKSIILFDLFQCPDFREYLKLHTKEEFVFELLGHIMNLYINYDHTIIGKSMCLGARVLGTVLNDGVIDFICGTLNADKDELINKLEKMVGGGSCTLVFKCKDYVIKLGPTRNNEHVISHFLIAPSFIRKKYSDGNIEMYVEQMPYCDTNNITKEQAEQLKHELYEYGIMWEDCKPENCGWIDPIVLESLLDHIYPEAEERTYENGISHYLGTKENALKRIEQAKKEGTKILIVVDSDDMIVDPYKLSSSYNQ